jgi:DNA-directed RNA polymerase subunit alpha
MRIRWRGLELPSRVVRDQQVSTDTYGKFTAEPFERGFGTTVGNSLRRILLSSLEGAAVTHIKLKGADHEFSSLPGVLEDVTDIILNIKSLIVRLDGDEPKEMKLAANKAGAITAGMITGDPACHRDQQGPDDRHAHRERAVRNVADHRQGAAATSRPARTSKTSTSRSSA